jgi:ABC-type multidrug transport system fused ATPase/permease subunit
MSSVVVNLSRNILMVAGLVGYLFYVDAILATIFFIVIPPAAIGLKFLGKKLRKAIRMSLERIGDSICLGFRNFKRNKDY